MSVEGSCGGQFEVSVFRFLGGGLCWKLTLKLGAATRRTPEFRVTNNDDKPRKCERHRSVYRTSAKISGENAKKSQSVFVTVSAPWLLQL